MARFNGIMQKRLVDRIGPAMEERRRRRREAHMKKQRGLSPDMKHKLTLFGGAALGVVMIVLLFTFFSNIFGGKEIMTKTELAFDGEIFATASSIYYMKGTTLYCTDLEGKELWSSKNNAEHMNIAGSDTFICVYNERTAIVTGPNQEARFTITPSDYNIKQVFCGNDVVVLLTETKEENPVQYLRAFDINGNDLQRTEIVGSELLQFGLHGEMDNLWTLMLDSSGIEPVSRITISNPAQNKMTGIIEVSDQLIYEVFFGEKNMYLMGTNNMMQYNSFNEKTSETLIYGLRCIDSVETATDNVFAFIQEEIENGENIYNIHLISGKDGKTPSDTLIQMPKGVKHAVLSDERLFCFSEDTLYLYKFTGEFEKETKLDIRITDVRKLTENMLLISADDGVYFYHI